MKGKIISLILIMLILATTLCSCINEPTLFTLKYQASEGGTIQGLLEQSVEQCNNGTTVTAIANEGYEFVKWSDNVVTATRQDKSVQEDITVTALFNKVVVPTQSFKLSYSCEEGGTIQGENTQTVEHGQNGSPVTAIANEGYEFVKWSDNVTTATRQDKIVIANISVTAIFQPALQSKTFALDYKYGECTIKPEQVTFVEDEINNVTLPVPAREHFTFGGWYCDDTQVADTNGMLILNNELLDFEQSNLYAKWTANETFTYKILLVYVTRIDATLYSSVTESDIKVDYTMSDLEREFCHLTTIRLKERLDDMLDGLVNFQVDEYYTQQVFTAEDFYQGWNGNRYDYDLFPNKIDEVSDIINDYDSVLSVVNRNDYKYLLHASSGLGHSKYGQICTDSAMEAFLNYNYTLEQVVSMMERKVDVRLWGQTYLIECYWLDTFIHELAHTIEMRVNLYDYHKCVIGELGINQHLSEREAYKQYYLKEAIIDGEKVGIPYSFWKGDIATVTCYVSRGEYGALGTTRSSHWATPLKVGGSDKIYEVVYNETITITAMPFDNNKFVCWSDGVTTPERTILITGDLTVTAIFEEIK